MHVLLSHPFFWPYVARGAEREVHDVGAALAARGHRVDLVTGQPHGAARRAVVDGVRVRYVRTPLPSALSRRGWRTEGVFGAVVACASLLSTADAVLCFHYADAVGASMPRRVGLRRRPLVLKLTGTVPRHRVLDNRVEHGLLRRALDAADEVWVNSRYAAEAMEEWGREMHVLPAGLDHAVFRPTADRAPRPTVLCAAAPDDPRKRLVDLVDAWPSVLAQIPEARLQLAGPASEATQALLLERLPAAARPSVEVLGVLRGEELVAAYSSAWVLAMPAVHEALGLVTLEALACGTPVAGARSGATPELLADPATGVLFEPLDPAACAEALIAALELAQRPDVRERCRAATVPFATDRIAARVEERLCRLT